MQKHQRHLFDTEPPPWELDDAEQRLVASVVFPEPPFGPFDYSVPDRLCSEVEPGRRLRVPLGHANRTLSGYCVGVELRRQGTRQLKEVRGVIDRQPLLSPAMLRLTAWMADYYLCTLGQVLDAVVPAGVRFQAGTREQAFLSVPTGVAARLTQLQLPPKQATVLKILAASARPLTPHELAAAARCTLAPIKELRDKNLIRTELRRVQHTNLAETPAAREQHLELNADQQAALAAVIASLQSGVNATTLIHGITGSGKTEVYIRAIDEVLHYGRQAIVLVPEISLTPQTRERFRSRFDRVAVLHSHQSPVERHWHWQQIARGEIDVVVGARSAIFAPTPNLGLIVLDEEHDASFKQDSAPRYHARDVAWQRAELENIPLVLGSATPSLESWHRAQLGVYRLVELPRRALDRPLPPVTLLDQRIDAGRGAQRGAISRQLERAMRQALESGGQVILLLNRRGFSTTIQCPKCGYVVKCRDCDIALTHHRDGELAICHYCDFQMPAPHICPECGFDAIRYQGLGTQRLEAEVRSRFSGVSVLRMDSDTMQRPGAHEQGLARFRAGEVQILLGTQMIAKGLDFPNVTLVGVINADTALHLPDFRAAERTFQLVTQVAGRTGRGEKGGHVLVQSFNPEHPAIQAAARHDYAAFVTGELPARQRYGYPPFTSVLRLIVRGDSEELANEFSKLVTGEIRQVAERTSTAVRILGPAPAPIAKLRGKYRFHVLLVGDEPHQLRQIVRDATGHLKPMEEVQWVVDVDPLDLQ